MTNEEMIQDLKQFVAATVHQEVAPLAQDVRALSEDVRALRKEVGGLDVKLDQVQDAIADTLTRANEATDESLQDYEKRLRRLEQRAA